MVSDACNHRILQAWTQSFLWRPAWSLLCNWVHCDIICFKYTVPEVDLSNFLTLTADNKKLLSPLQSEDIKRYFEWCIAKLNLFSCYPLQTAITWILLCLQWSSVKWLIWLWTQSQDVYGSLANICSTQPIPTSPLLKSSVSAVTFCMVSVGYS